MARDIIAIGDSYMSAELFTEALRQRGLEADSATVTITSAPTWSTDGLREFEGDPAEVSALIQGHSVVAFHGAPISRRVLEENPSVRLLACARGGPVNVDLDAAAELGVAVATTPGKNAAAVADLTIGFMIDLLRNTAPARREAERLAAAGEPLAESAFEGARWFGRELTGRRLGLIGLGNVGRLVAARAVALGVEVLAFDPFVPLGSVEGVRQLASLEELLPQVDVLSLHARATADNHHLMSFAQFAALSFGASFINTARESLVDEAALLDAVRTGHISGAALDVCERDGLWRLLIAEPGVMITPHTAGATFETLERGAQMLADEIQSFLSGPRTASPHAPSQDPVVLAVDAGTGSARAIAFALDGAVVARSAREWTHAATPGHPGGTDFDTAAGWRLISEAVREVVARIGSRPVLSVGVSSMREGFVLYDEHGDELFACPNTDGRARAQAGQLAANGLADRIYQLSGDWVSITAPPRLLWLKQEQPDRLQAARHLGMLSDWVVYRLTGEFTTDPTCGSSSALFDLTTRDWSDELAEAIGIPRKLLPQTLECGTVAGAVTPAASAQTGLPVGTPVMVGGADTQLALHGIGAYHDIPTVVAGTFWQTTFIRDTPAIDPNRRLRTLCYVTPGSWMVEGIGFLSGLAMRWFRDAFCPDATAEGGNAYDAMERWASAAPRGANGLVAVLSNVMQADAWHHAAPAFVGFDLNSPGRFDRGTFVRAIEEAAAFVVRAHLDILDDITCGAARRPGELVLTGGSSKGALWPKIIAEVTAATVRQSTAPEATAYGAARLAAAGVGVQLPPVGRSERIITPTPQAVAEYDSGYQHWSEVYKAQLAATRECGATPLFTPPGGLSDGHAMASPTEDSIFIGVERTRGMTWTDQ